MSALREAAQAYLRLSKPFEGFVAADAEAALRAALRASLAPDRDAETQEFVWLIERDLGQAQPEYWAGTTRWGLLVREDWTIDPFKARHYPTRAEADAAITSKGIVLRDSKAVEHGFAPSLEGARHPEAGETFLEAVTALIDAVLDRPYADPDDDAAKAARALLRIDPSAASPGARHDVPGALDVERLARAIVPLVVSGPFGPEGWRFDEDETARRIAAEYAAPGPEPEPGSAS